MTTRTLKFSLTILQFSVPPSKNITNILQTLFKKLRDKTVYAKRSKCIFAQQQIEFCGYIVGQNGERTQPGNLQLVADWKTPQNAQDIQ